MKTINEHFMQELYHYTDISKLKLILKDNKIKCSDTEQNAKDKAIHKKIGKEDYRYYFCFARNRDGRVGYPNQYKRKVRLTIDMSALNSKFEVRPLDFFGKKAMYNKPNKNWEKMADQAGFEREERLFSKDEYIEPANKYITRIDIFDEYELIGPDEIKLLDKLFPGKYYIYTDETKWRFQK